jgi:hypothetical protein
VSEQYIFVMEEHIQVYEKKQNFICSDLKPTVAFFMLGHFRNFTFSLQAINDDEAEGESGAHSSSGMFGKLPWKKRSSPDKKGGRGRSYDSEGSQDRSSGQEDMSDDGLNTSGKNRGLEKEKSREKVCW